MFTSIVLCVQISLQLEVSWLYEHKIKKGIKLKHIIGHFFLQVKFDDLHGLNKTAR